MNNQKSTVIYASMSDEPRMLEKKLCKPKKAFNVFFVVIATILLTLFPNIIINGENITTYNAGSFNVEGGTSGTDWTYDVTDNKLKFLTNGTYAVIGNGTETNEEINVEANFEGTITIRNINAKKLGLDKTAKLTLFIDGTNTLREGLRFDSPETGSYLIIDSKTNGSLVARGGYQESGIGGGYGQNGGNITIKGGNITATGGSNGGAGIGSGYNRLYSNVSNITISGGTVTANGNGYGSDGIGTGCYGSITSNIVITGGSVRASSFGIDPTDGKGNKVYLTKIEKLSNVNANITIDGTTTFKLTGNHDDNDKMFYLYLTGENHTLKIDDTSYSLIWRENEKIFLYPYSNLFDRSLNIATTDGDTSCIKYDINNKIHYILKDGTYTVSNDKTEANEGIRVDDNINATLILNSANIKRDNEVISLGNNTKLEILFNGENNIETTGNVAAITTTSENSYLTFDSNTNGILNVTANKGVGIGSMWNTYNITFNGGTINAKGNDYCDSDIGIGLINVSGDYYAKNIVVNGGVVNCITSGLGSSYSGNRDYSKQCQITINGGTVTAPIIGGSKYATEFRDSISKVIINGGSVKGTIQVSKDDENKFDTVYDINGNKVYLLKIDKLSGINKVKVDNNLEYTRNGNHPNDGAFYLYLTGSDHTISVNNKVFCYAKWKEEDKKFQIVRIAPTVSIDSKFSDCIKVKALEDQDIYGEAEYSTDKETWQTSNIFEDLSVDTQYTIYARYKGINNYLQSETGSTTVRTMKDGKVLLNSKKPSNLTGIYEQDLSDINLPDDWRWDDEETALSVGKNNYLAVFNTSDYKDEYDFSDVSNYDSTNFEAEVNLAIDVSKAESSLLITSDIDKTYDGEVVDEPTVDKSGSSNELTFTWYLKNNDEFAKLESSPKNAGIYKVVINVDSDENYNGKEIEKTFEISKAVPDVPSIDVYTLRRGYALSSINLPEGFRWKDSSIKAEELGRHKFKAIYTPTDIKNYETVELDISIDVYEVITSYEQAEETVNQKQTIDTEGKQETPKEEVINNDKENVNDETDDTKKEEKENISSESVDEVIEKTNIIPWVIVASILFAGMVIILIIKHKNRSN